LLLAEVLEGKVLTENLRPLEQNVCTCLKLIGKNALGSHTNNEEQEDGQNGTA
jgi:hypothetical protein